MSYLDKFDSVCDCGNGISFADMGEGAECCEWCLPENRFDGIMWRRRGDVLEQMETHGFDKLYTVELTGKSVSVWANSQEIAEYIALEADSILKVL
jgi:hypothetical protein